jgi:homoserine O-succinyltransferase/O-acetyltransferase
MMLAVKPTNDAVCRDGGCVDVALVNNMPDAALQQTEVQFARLLDAGSGDLPVHLRRYTLPTIARRSAAAEHIEGHYFPIDALWDSPPDALIITGCEPISPDLTREPFWPELSRLLHWARENVPSTIASCLAAHGALLAFDAVHRHRLPVKRSGVFPQEVRPDDPLNAGLPARIVMPHSRLNDVPTEAVEACGYRPLISSRGIGWTVAVKEFGEHLLVLLQGHPEYDADTLLFEFRRDVRRYLGGEREDFPAAPTGYFPPDAMAILTDLRDHAAARRLDRRAMDLFPTSQLEARVSGPWREPAQLLFGNWLAEVWRRATEPVGV